MLSARLLLICAMLALASAASTETSSDSPPCSLKADGLLYNFASLTRSDDDYLVDQKSVNSIGGTELDGVELHVNVCGKTKAGTDVGAYKKANAASGGKLISIGKFDTHIRKRDDFLELQYINGEDGKASTIFFECSKDTSDAPTLLATFNNQYFIFHWKTTYACGTVISTGHKSASGFGIAILVLLAIYFGGGFAYNRYQGKRGREQIPHSDLWFGVMAALMELFTSCVALVTKKRNTTPANQNLSFSGDRYRNLPQNDDTTVFVNPNRQDDDEFEEQR